MKNWFIILFFLWLLTGCEKETIVFPDITDIGRKISVVATLDTDDGQFQVLAFKVISLPEYSHPFRSNPEIRTGRVLLYEDGELILDVKQEFDLIEVWNRDDEYERQFLSCEGLTVRAGSVYQLEVAIDGYDPVTSVATMPYAPVVKSIQADTLKLFYSNNVYCINSLVHSQTSGSNTGLFYLLHVELEDLPVSSGYYTIQMVEERLSNDEITYDAMLIGSDDWSILSDNPVIVANERDLLDSGDTHDIFAFAPFFFSNRSFVNSFRHFTFYMPFTRNEWNYNGIRAKQYVMLKQITKETWEFNRAYYLQYAGLDFFNSEPVTVPSNIQNGYGCFSLSNTVKFMVLEYSF